MRIYKFKNSNTHRKKRLKETIEYCVPKGFKAFVLKIWHIPYGHIAQDCEGCRKNDPCFGNYFFKLNLIRIHLFLKIYQGLNLPNRELVCVTKKPINGSV